MEVHHGGSIPVTQGDMLIRGLWESKTEAIIGVRFGDADTDPYKKEKMDTLLPRWENTNKDKHGWHFHKQQKHPPPFVLSLYGIMDEDVLATLSRLMAEKMEEPILHVKGWVNFGSQLRSRGCTTGCSTDIGSQVPYGPRIYTGSQVRYWTLWNKFLVPR